jgi:hypothetical protein
MNEELNQEQQEPIKVPQTPEEQLNNELRIWGGGIDITFNLDENRVHNTDL